MSVIKKITKKQVNEFLAVNGWTWKKGRITKKNKDKRND